MSGTPGLSGSARAVIAAQKSAEGIVAGPPAKARTTDRVIRTAGSCGPSGRTSSWNWPWSRRRGVKPGAPETEGPKPVWRVPTPNARRLSSTGSASPPCEAVPQLKSVEPPCTDPYARWCGRGGAVRLPPIPISAEGSKGWGPQKSPGGRQRDTCVRRLARAISRANRAGARRAQAGTGAHAGCARKKGPAACRRPGRRRRGRNGAERSAMEERYAGTEPQSFSDGMANMTKHDTMQGSSTNRPAPRSFCHPGLEPCADPTVLCRNGHPNMHLAHGEHDRT